MPNWLKIVLRLLKMECKSHDICDDCPLYRPEEDCMLSCEMPVYWEDV